MALQSSLTTVSASMGILLALASAVQAGGALPDSGVVMKALVDELDRSMEGLVLEDLARPYFIQFTVRDRLMFSLAASHGGLQESEDRHTRILGSSVRVGSRELDNTNMRHGFGGRALLPLDDDYTALRHAIWRSTDGDYKGAVESLARKVAYLKDKTIEDRPHDFSNAEPVIVKEPSAEVHFDENAWEERVTRLSAGFNRHGAIQNSDVTFLAGVENQWIVNSEGTRLRTGDTGALLEIDAELQAKEGMMLYDSRSYLAKQPDQLPPIDRMLTDIDEMCGKLVTLGKAPILEHYSGPVLFEPVAAGQVFHSLLAEGLCARPVPLGRRGDWGDESLEKKIGLRILPRSFQVYDDPRTEVFGETLLAGAYRYDDEAVPAARVNIVENGILKNLVAGRAPTKKVKQSTGHGRSRGFGAPRSEIGCLYISDADGMTVDELKQELLQAAREEGLAYGLRIESMEEGGRRTLGRPIYAYKVYVDDGREELVRGLEFLPVETRSLKRILAGGKTQKVYNSVSGIAFSIISPAVVFEELELTRLEEEFDKPPILEPPVARKR